jgi:hypothetical protein
VALTTNGSPAACARKEISPSEAITAVTNPTNLFIEDPLNLRINLYRVRNNLVLRSIRARPVGFGGPGLRAHGRADQWCHHRHGDPNGVLVVEPMSFDFVVISRIWVVAIAVVLSGWAAETSSLTHQDTESLPNTTYVATSRLREG